jgi:hypothetical protein
MFGTKQSNRKQQRHATEGQANKNWEGQLRSGKSMCRANIPQLSKGGQKLKTPKVPASLQ